MADETVAALLAQIDRDVEDIARRREQIDEMSAWIEAMIAEIRGRSEGHAMRTVTIGIATMDDVKRSALAAFAGEKQGEFITFPSRDRRECGGSSSPGGGRVVWH